MNDLLARLAHGLLTAAARMLPREAATWADAMRRELTEAPDSWAAFRFAAGCLRAAAMLAATARISAFRDLARPVWWSRAMTNVQRRPRLLGLVCGALAVAAGLVHLSLAGAPARYLLVNVLALALGATLWVRLGGASRSRPPAASLVVLALAGGLLATALFGVAVEGASRWIQFGPISVQTSLAFVPAMVVLYARRVDVIGTAGMAIAALALALQPDRAMAGVLAAGLLAVVMLTRGRLPALATVAAALAFAWTLSTPDTLPAVPFVDGVFFTAFGVHPIAGAAVVAGAALLLAPAMARISERGAERTALVSFGACWFAVIAAAALGNYPTPLVGYGGAAVLGYLLSAALLPSGARQNGARLAAKDPAALDRASADALPRLRLARSVAPC